MKRIILITGGARSGKSTYAEKLAAKTAFGKCRRLFLNNSKLYHFTLISSASCG